MQFELFSEVKLTKDLPEDNLLKGMTAIIALDQKEKKMVIF